MWRFSSAVIQIHITMQSDIVEMRKRMQGPLSSYPQFQMVEFSELAPHGPALSWAQPIGGMIEREPTDLARRYHLWQVPGSQYEKDRGRLYSTPRCSSPRANS